MVATAPGPVVVVVGLSAVVGLVEGAGFVVVTAPEGRSLEEAGHFVDRLEEAGMHLLGVVVNRWRTS